MRPWFPPAAAHLGLRPARRRIPSPPRRRRCGGATASPPQRSGRLRIVALLLLVAVRAVPGWAADTAGPAAPSAGSPAGPGPAASAIGASGAGPAPSPPPAGQHVAPPQSIYDVVMPALDGGSFAFSRCRGQVLLVVNVASRCGFTPQYQALEAVYRTFRDRGLVVVGVPANDFANQEPGSSADIRHVCSDIYHVTFPMLAKVKVTGNGCCPLYRLLTGTAGFRGPITWNFTKFLIDRRGAVAARFAPKVHPDDPQVLSAIAQALAAPDATAGPGAPGALAR
jgi:glutathione peroxidase